MMNIHQCCGVRCLNEYMTFILLFVRYSDFLLQEDNEDIIPFSVATGDTQQLVSYFHSIGQYQEAMVTSQAACEDAFHHPHLLKKAKSPHGGGAPEADLDSYKRYASCWCEEKAHDEMDLLFLWCVAPVWDQV